MPQPPGVIKRSVGVAGQNQRSDVELVQTLLNAVPIPRGGPSSALDVDGLCGPLTNGAIKRFQYLNECPTDGRIDPGLTTEKALLALLEALGKLIGLIGPGGGTGTTTTTTPIPHGPDTPVRRRYIATALGLLPSRGTLSNDTRPKVGTNCGEFPGRVFTHFPVIHPSKRGAFKVKVPGAGTLYLTSPTTWWEELAKAVDKEYAPAKKCWVPFSGSNRPLPGDVYLLAKFETPSQFQHVGVIIDPTGSSWTTGDGGQGNGGQFGLVTRTFQPDGVITGEFGNKARLKGWVDLDYLFAVAVAAFPANL